MRGGTEAYKQVIYLVIISIHPPRAGRDIGSAGFMRRSWDFNPPAPCGAGPDMEPKVTSTTFYFNPPAPCGAGQKFFGRSLHIGLFQSTRPVRGGTSPVSGCCAKPPISIHPPRAGRDSARAGAAHHITTFQSTRPVRGGTSLS